MKTFEKYKVQLKSPAAAVNDTIGAVAVDAAGNVASTVSSGGNWMKIPGRVGHVRKTEMNVFFNSKKNNTCFLIFQYTIR